MKQDLIEGKILTKNLRNKRLEEDLWELLNLP